MSFGIAARSLRRLATGYCSRTTTTHALYAANTALTHVRHNSNLPQGLPPGINLDNFDKEAFVQSEMFKKIKENPAALDSLSKLGTIIKEKGVFYALCCTSIHWAILSQASI